MDYLGWQVHFKCLSVSSSPEGIEIAMEESDSHYHFNIQFQDSRAIGVSIDS
jgi:hypothetical protein